ncbi:hypothetical protein LINPERPRIM_LOCUS11178 [Linum perenne]
MEVESWTTLGVHCYLKS